MVCFLTCFLKKSNFFRLLYKNSLIVLGGGIFYPSPKLLVSFFPTPKLHNIRAQREMSNHLIEKPCSQQLINPRVADLDKVDHNPDPGPNLKKNWLRLSRMSRSGSDPGKNNLDANLIKCTLDNFFQFYMGWRVKNIFFLTKKVLQIKFWMI